MGKTDFGNFTTVVYGGHGDSGLSVKTDGETVWLTQEQMCLLFGRERSVVTKHIRNVFKEGELSPESVCAKFAHTAPDGKVYQVAFYNLDVVISVGYRVKSIQGTRFRQWATRILREMLLKRVDEVREIGEIKRRMDAAEGDIRQIKNGMGLLVRQLAAPDEPPRRRIGFGADSGDAPAKPYGKAQCCKFVKA